MTEDRGPSPDGVPANVESILGRRKLTRAVAEAVRLLMVEYLGTLTPLLRPRVVLGDYVQGGHKESARKADKAFKELQALYESVAAAKPFNLPRELKPPIDLPGGNLEVTPLDYPHVARAGDVTRTISVRSPLSWVLSYSGLPPSRFREVIDPRSRGTDEVQRYVLAYLSIHVVLANQPGITGILEALHFPVSTFQSHEFGELPLTGIRAAISTSRPPDDLLVRMAELTGVDAFEEVVDVQDIAMLRDPLKARLLEIVRAEAPELVPADT